MVKPDAYWCLPVGGYKFRLSKYIYSYQLIDGTYIIGSETEQILYGK